MECAHLVKCQQTNRLETMGSPLGFHSSALWGLPPWWKATRKLERGSSLGTTSARSLAITTSTRALQHLLLSAQCLQAAELQAVTPELCLWCLAVGDGASGSEGISCSLKGVEPLECDLKLRSVLYSRPVYSSGWLAYISTLESSARRGCVCLVA